MIVEGLYSLVARRNGQLCSNKPISTAHQEEACKKGFCDLAKMQFFFSRQEMQRERRATARALRS